MSKINRLHQTLVLAAFSLGVTAVAQSGKVGTKAASTFPKTVKNPKVGEIIVKCAGIVKKGQNHCGANGHACNGLSAKDPKIKDFDKNEWIYVRKEVCDATAGKIVGKKKVTKG